MPGRTTIVDVARAAGVSKGAASHALNGRRGVSEETRERVKAAAAALGWSPNGVARALSGARAGAVGWAILKSGKSASVDPYFTELFAGIELELAQTDLALVVKLVGDREEEELLYRRWASERRVDGVLLTEFDAGDRRLDLLRDLELPVAAMSNFVGGDPGQGAVPAVWQDEGSAVGTLLDHAFAGGHRRIGWITGPGDKRAVLLREEATLAWAARTGATVTTVYTDYGPAQGAAAAKRLLSGDSAPTLLVFDNDRMALAGLSTCHELGLGVPRDLSIASFVDSELCAISVPPVTALRHDIVGFGRSLTRRLLDTLDGRDEPDVVLPALVLEARASIGPPSDR